ncbi:MAG: N-acetyltransferase [Candidatus Kapabacteria bacterium]|nr:N-acetyltransferase [Candidatus Kapabacteria bacterium]
MEIQHSFNGQKGSYYIKQNDILLAEMTYVMSGEASFIIDHTFVDSSLKGQGIGRKLLDNLIEYARVNHLKIIPLCPFAKSVFDKDETIRDVLK